jgi:hypothetical protein
LLLLKSLKEISDQVQQWNYNFITATYYILLFMKMQGRQPKIKPNMKKYSQCITFANCIQTTTLPPSTSTIATTIAPPPSNSATSATTTANRILVEKQLAALSTNNGTQSATMTKTNKDKVTDRTHKTAENNNNKQNNENVFYSVTPIPNSKQITNSGTRSTGNSNSNQKHPKALHFDEIKVSDQSKVIKQNQQQQQQREARPKTKTTPKTNNTKVVTAAAAATIQNKQQYRQTSHNIEESESSTSSASASSSSSESLSGLSGYSTNTTTESTAPTSSNKNTFAMPSRVTRSKKNNENIQHNSRAASASCSTSNNSGPTKQQQQQQQQQQKQQDTIFIPPKTPIRSKTRDCQYTTPTTSGTATSKFVSKSDSMKVKVTPSKSMDSDLNSIFSPSTPVTKKSQSVDNDLNRMDNTPNSRRTPVFGSIERGLDKVKTIFTPRRRLNSTTETPRKAKDTCNITVTNTLNPDTIIDELVNVVNSKHLLYERKGFCLRLSVCDDWGRVKLAFDLEVVQLKTKQLGIRRKRVKGDTWHYKKYCEDVIKSANICFSNANYSALNIPNGSGSSSLSTTADTSNDNNNSCPSSTGSLYQNNNNRQLLSSLN